MSIAETKHNIWSFVKHYSYGCFAKSWNGAWASIYAFLGLATGNSLDPEHFSAPNIYTMLYVFVVAFAINAIGYFKDNPIPDKLYSNPPFAPSPSDPQPPLK